MYERWYVITFIDDRHYLPCEAIYGIGRTIDEALSMAEKRWEEEGDQAQNALGVSDEEMSVFCTDCDIGKFPECIYCDDPFYEIERRKDQIVKSLDELSLELEWARQNPQIAVIK